MRLTISRLRRLCPPGVQDSSLEPLGHVARIERTVGVATQLLPLHLSCLPRALIVQALMQHAGLDGRLRIGVCAGEGGVAAHAWVDFEGVPVGDSLEVVRGFSAFEGLVSPEIVAAMTDTRASRRELNQTEP